MAEEERVEPTLEPGQASGSATATNSGEKEALEPPRKSNKTLLIAVALIVVIGGGVGGYLYLDHAAKVKKEHEEEANRPENILKRQLTERKENAPPIYIPMEEMIVNLPGRGGEHYLQTKIVLRTADSGTESKIKQFEPQPKTADKQNLERIGVIPKETSSGQKISSEAAKAAAEFWNVTEMDLPVQAVLFSTFVMQ